MRLATKRRVMKQKSICWAGHFAIAFCCLLSAWDVAAQGSTAFTYQGQLRDGGTNANGTYPMTFSLYDASSGGNQIGSTVSTSPTLANGLFSVNLDFGSSAFDGNPRWLEITVKSGTNAAETLAPRPQVLPAPYALFSATAATVTNGAITQIKIATNQVVKSLNGLADAVTLAVGSSLAMTTNGRTLTLSASTNYSPFAEGAFPGMKIVIGGVLPDGTLAGGVGFTSSRTSEGHYHITFSSAFSQYPAVSVSGGRAFYEVVNLSGAGFDVITSHDELYNPTGDATNLALITVIRNEGFSLIAVGSK